MLRVRIAPGKASRREVRMRGMRGSWCGVGRRCHWKLERVRRVRRESSHRGWPIKVEGWGWGRTVPEGWTY